MVGEGMIKALALKHVRRFSDLITAGLAGRPNIRVDECKNFLKIWESIKEKGKWDTLNRTERMELMDAHDDDLGEREARDATKKEANAL